MLPLVEVFSIIDSMLKDDNSKLNLQLAGLKTTCLGIALFALSGIMAVDVSARSSGSTKAAETAECKECTGKAQVLFAQNNVSAALSLLKANKDKCSESFKYNLLYSTILLRSKGQEKQALAYAVKAQALDPGSLVANFQAGIAAMIADDKEKSVSYFKKATALDPGNYEAWSALGKIYGELGDEEQVKVCQAKAACLEPKSRQAKIRMLRGVADAGSSSALRKEFDRLLEDASLEPEFFTFVAKEAYDLGVFDKAESACDRVLKAYPSSSECKKIKLLSLLWRNKYDEARTILDANKVKSPDMAAASALINLKTGKFKESPALAKAAESEPDSAVVLLASGTRFAQQGKYQEAIAALRRSLKNNELFAPSHIELCRIYIKQKDYESALQEAREIGRSGGFEAVAKAMESRVNLAQGPAAENMQKADVLARQAYKLDQNAPEVLISLARVHLKAGRMQESKKLAEKALAIEPGNDEAILLVSEIK